MKKGSMNFGIRIRERFFDLFRKIPKIIRYRISWEDQLEDLVKNKGLRLGKNVIIDPEAKIDRNFAFLISIGDNSIICEGVRLLAHDGAIQGLLGGYNRVGKIEIMENCIISVDSVILPGVTIGPNVIVSAGSVVNKDIPPNSCVAGVPARFYAKFEDVIDRYVSDITPENTFDRIDFSKYGFVRDIDREQKMIEVTQKGNGWFKE